MTEDYKKRLIEYTTHLLNTETSQPTDYDPYEEVIENDDYSSDVWQIVMDTLGTRYCMVGGILEDESSENYIMYGGYQDVPSENSKGFLIYMNSENHPFKVVLLPNVRGFQLLKFDKSSNRVYGVCCNRASSWGSQDNDAYFCYFNNLFLTYTDDYPPQQLYATRIFQGSGGSQENQYKARDIIKHPDYSYYLIFGTTENNLMFPKVYELRINVGEADEFKQWVVPDGSRYDGMCFLGWYNDETPHFKGILTNTYNTLGFVLFQDNGDNVSLTNLTCDTTLYGITTSRCHPEFVALGQNNIYFEYNVAYEESGIYTQQACVYRYDGTTTIKTICKSLETLTEGVIKNVPMINLVQDAENVYAIKYENDDDLDFCRITLINLTKHPNPQENEWKEIGEGTSITSLNAFNTRARLVRQYNLVNFVSYAGYFRNLGIPSGNIDGFCNIFTTIISALGYTGYKYINNNVLVPSYVNLYNNNNILFSRNVYDTTTFGNTTTTSVEVPNNYLNNITIDEEKLLGQTNYTLVEATKQIQKNIYEILHINYFNTINVIDEDTNTEYPIGASLINKATTNGGNTNYNNAPCLKYRVNYEDNTTYIQDINWYTINDYNKQTYFVISVNKAIKNIDLISNDGTTIYITINGDFEIGKDYLITQKVRIGEKSISNDLQYNGENVLYNNNQVQVYSQ